MQLVDVLNKLRELEKTNESVKDAIDSAKRMNGEDNLTEAQRLYSVKLENDKGVTKNVRVKAGSEQEAKDRKALWQRRRMLNNLQDKALIIGAVMIVTIYLHLLFLALRQMRIAKWGS